MDDDVVETIERQIKADRRALDRNIQELEDRAQAALDWRRQFRDHTGAILAVALGGGLLAGAWTRARQSSARDDHDYAPVRDEAPRRSLLRAVDPSGRATGHVSDLVEDIVDAFVGLAGAAAVEYIGGAVPGFREHFDARARSRPL